MQANIKTAFHKAFPDRQIYYRSGGTVKYVTISPWQQALLATAAFALVGWTLFATVDFLSSEPSSPKYVVEDLRSKESFQRTLLEERSRETVELEEKQKVLESLLNDMEPLRGDSAAIQSIPNDGRVSKTRDPLVPPIPGTPRAIEASMESMLYKMQDIAVERTEYAKEIVYSVIEQAPESPMGGPVFSYNDPFTENLAYTAFRIAEMKHYEYLIETMPLDMPVKVPFRYTSLYGVRIDPFTRRPGVHFGTDFAAYRDAPILSTAPGTVTYAGPRGGYGLFVEIDHNNGFKSRYGHLSSYLVKKGDYVQRGELIARMGSTGRSTGDHLHYEIWYNNNPQDPMKFLKVGKNVRN